MKSRVIQSGAWPPAPFDRTLSTSDELPPGPVRHHAWTVATLLNVVVAVLAGRGARGSRG